MSWRLAKSLGQLLAQVNGFAPDRNRSSDGTVGDLAHSGRVSDHNPNSQGIVTALDVTHDPYHGVDSYKIAEQLRVSRDKRIKYVISNRRIFNGEGWNWRPYSGSNPHSMHMHVSVGGGVDSIVGWSVKKTGLAEKEEIVESPIIFGRIRKGDAGASVKQLQSMLGNVEDDGIFGTRTEIAVKGFQRRNRLEVDGIVGPYTWEVLNQQKKESVL